MRREERGGGRRGEEGGEGGGRRREEGGEGRRWCMVLESSPRSTGVMKTSSC